MIPIGAAILVGAFWICIAVISSAKESRKGQTNIAAALLTLSDSIKALPTNDTVRVLAHVIERIANLSVDGAH